MVQIGTKQSDFMCKENKVMFISMIVNFSLALLKVITGIIFSSQALVADGVHSFSDLTTDIFAIIGNKLSDKPADDKHPFGHGKLEYLTSMGIGLIILFVGFGIIYNSFNSKLIIPDLIVIVVSLLTIIIKYILSGYVIRKGKEFNNNILIASGKESSMDVVSSVVALVSALFMQLSNIISVFKYADIVATIVVGIFIVKVGFDILKENISYILGEQETDEELIEKITNIITSEELIIRLDKLAMIKYGAYFKIVGEVSMDESLTLKESHDVVEKIERLLLEFDERNRYITIHVNPYLVKKASK